MLSNLKHWFSLDLLKNEEDKRLGRILLTIILSYELGSLVVLILDLLWGDKSLYGYLILGVIFQLIPLVLLLRGKASPSSFMTVAIYIGFLTLFATTGQGIRDYVIVGYPAVIMFAGLTEQWRGLIMSTFLTLVAFVWLILGEMNNWFIVKDLHTLTIYDLIIVSLIVLVAALAVQLLVANLDYRHKQTLQELAERKRAEEALRENRENLQALIENSDGSIWSVNVQYELIIGNELYHHQVSDAAGRTVKEGESVFKLDLPEEALVEWKGYYDRALRGEKFSIEAQTRFTSQPRTIEYRFNPIRDEKDEIIGVTVFGRDITERKHIESALAQSEQRFKSYINNAPNIITVIDHKNCILYLNRTEFDLPQSMFIGNSIFNFISPEQKESAEHALRQAKETGQPCLYYTTSKVRDTMEWYENYAMVSDPQNPESDVVIVSTNISERKRAEEALRESEAMYRLLAENISDVIWILDMNTRYFRYISPSVERLRGYSVEEVLAQDMSAALTPNSLQDIQQKLPTRLQAYSQGEHNFYVDELEQPCKGGDTVWTETTTNFHVNENNGHLEVFGVSRDITVRKQTEALLQKANEQLYLRLREIEILQGELSEQALRDPLTGLYNRRYLSDALERELARARRNRKSLSVIVMDIDRFKKINDGYGHQVGDKFLRVIAQLLGSHTRESDFACRYGGEEFLLVLPGTTSRIAAKRAEELRLKCSQIQILHENKKLGVTLSLGVATYPRHGGEAEDIVIKADKALYKSKRNGRNRVTVWGEKSKAENAKH